VYPREDHAMIGRRFVADARVAYARDGAESRAAQIVDALLDRSAAFAELWKRHDVSTTREQTKRIAHPKLGILDVQCQILYDAAQLHTLLVFTADPGSTSHAKLAALGADPDAYSRGDRREPALLNGGSPITG
jgi:MmyB-like transcription regulator ligand binding domain